MRAAARRLRVVPAGWLGGGMRNEAADRRLRVVLASRLARGLYERAGESSLGGGWRVVLGSGLAAAAARRLGVGFGSRWAAE